MRRFFKDIKAYFSYALYSAKAELKAEISSSYLNWIWWVLEPLSFMFIYMFIYGVVFGGTQPQLPLFIFIGLTCWNFFNKCVLTSVKLVQNNTAIVSKVYLPKFILVLEKMLVNGFKMLVSFVLAFIMMPFFGVPFSWKFIFFTPFLLLLLLFTFGFCCWLMHFGVFVEDLSYIINIALRLVFYATGVFYPIEDKLQEPLSSILLNGNPIAFVIDGLRDALLYNQLQLEHLLFWVIWALASLVIIWSGIKVIYRYENSYVKVI